MLNSWLNTTKFCLTEMCLNSGRLLHHFTILYSRWSATLHKLAIRSGLEVSFAKPALASSGFVAGLLPAIETGGVWLSRVSSVSLYCHRCSTSMISCEINKRLFSTKTNSTQTSLPRTCNNVGILCRACTALPQLPSAEFSTLKIGPLIPPRYPAGNALPSALNGGLSIEFGSVYEHWYVERPPRVRSSRIASNFIPRWRHFSKRQAGHFFRVAMVTGQAAPRRQT